MELFFRHGGQRIPSWRERARSKDQDEHTWNQ
jgi:hypothetical protein